MRDLLPEFRSCYAPYHNSFECNCHISSPSTTMEPPTSTKLRSALISASNNNANRASPLKLTLQSHTKRARTKFELRCGNQRGSKSRNHSNKRWHIFLGPIPRLYEAHTGGLLREHPPSAVSRHFLLANCLLDESRPGGRCCRFVFVNELSVGAVAVCFLGFSSCSK